MASCRDVWDILFVSFDDGDISNTKFLISARRRRDQPSSDLKVPNATLWSDGT